MGSGRAEERCRYQRQQCDSHGRPKDGPFRNTLDCVSREIEKTSEEATQRMLNQKVISVWYLATTLPRAQDTCGARLNRASSAAPTLTRALNVHRVQAVHLFKDT